MSGVISIGIRIDRRFLRSARATWYRREHPQLALSNRYGDAVVAEQAPDRAVHVRAYIVDAVHRICDPEAHLEAHSVVFEGHQPRHRWRVMEDARMVGHRIG